MNFKLLTNNFKRKLIYNKVIFNNIESNVSYYACILLVILSTGKSKNYSKREKIVAKENGCLTLDIQTDGIEKYDKSL